MRKILIALLVSAILFSSCNKVAKEKTILVVLAHPDDEDAMGPLLVKYGKLGKVYLIIATDGRLGIKPGYPTGDSLVSIRQNESQCRCKKMGIEPPIFLGFPDGFDTRNGVGAYMDQSMQLKEQLTQKIKDINPSLIITFGPDGDTGHSDHRMISNMTTEIILKEGWVEKFPLYYIGWTKKDDEKFKMIGGLNTVNKKYLNVAISYTQEEENIAMQAILCNKSQLTEKEMQEWIDVEQKDSSNTFHFRQLVIATGKKTEF
ncbi:MAG: PIG-L family deacetylase [Ferruginibacter sp.]|nr:PIG-L family deacetylase [Ferruginibacter sp.]